MYKSEPLNPAEAAIDSEPTAPAPSSEDKEKYQGSPLAKTAHGILEKLAEKLAPFPNQEG